MTTPLIGKTDQQFLKEYEDVCDQQNEFEVRKALGLIDSQRRNSVESGLEEQRGRWE